MSKFHLSLIFAGVILVAAFVRVYFVHQPPTDLPALTVEETIIDSGVGNDSMPAIEDPIFESVPAADTYLQNDGQGIVLISGRQAKFYPFQILVWHNFVDDIWGGLPILVAYDPLCGSSAVFERAESSEVFINSGKIYNNNILFTSPDNNSLWSSFSGRVLVGSESDRGLEKTPALIMSWQDFRYAFPGGQVLSRETGVNRDYSQNPYGSYASSPDIWYPLSKYDAGLPAKTFVYGYGDVAFPQDNIKSSEQIIAETESGKIAFVWDEDWATVRGFGIEADESLGEEVALSSAYWFCWVVR